MITSTGQLPRQLLCFGKVKKKKKTKKQATVIFSKVLKVGSFLSSSEFGQKVATLASRP